MSRPNRKIVAGMAIFTAFVAAATMAFSFYIPASRGYFNMGEIMVYTCALIMGPLVGAFAGGVGSMIADISLGYTQYAPATLIIKGAEGLIVGYLSHRKLGYSKIGWRIFSSATGLAIALLIGWIGVNYYSGGVEATLGMPLLGYQTLSLYVPMYLWIIIAFLAFILTLVAGFLVDPTVGWPVISILSGGLVMISGYFLYESYILGFGAALVEIPVNAGQLMVGLIVSIPLARNVQRLLSR